MAIEEQRCGRTYREVPQGGPLKTSESSFPREPDEGLGKAVWAYLDCVEMQPGLDLGDTVEGRISNLKSGKEGLEPGCLSHVLGETAEGWAGEGGLGDRK